METAEAAEAAEAAAEAAAEEAPGRDAAGSLDGSRSSPPSSC